MEAHVLRDTATLNRTTLPVYQLGCAGGGAHTIEVTLRRLAGVRHVYVNPATEMAYVAYDSTLVDVSALTAAIEQAGFGAPQVQSVSHSRIALPSQPAASRQELSLHTNVQRRSTVITFLTSRTGLVLLALLGIAGYYLVTAHSAHLVGWLPYGLVLLCPLMHLFMHGGHGNHAGHEQSTTGQNEHTEHGAAHSGHLVSRSLQEGK